LRADGGCLAAEHIGMGRHDNRKRLSRQLAPEPDFPVKRK
jgi:hypothetical protein